MVSLWRPKQQATFPVGASPHGPHLYVPVSFLNSIRKNIVVLVRVRQKHAFKSFPSLFSSLKCSDPSPTPRDPTSTHTASGIFQLESHKAMCPSVVGSITVYCSFIPCQQFLYFSPRFGFSSFFLHFFLGGRRGRVLLNTKYRYLTKEWKETVLQLAEVRWLLETFNSKFSDFHVHGIWTAMQH